MLSNEGIFLLQTVMVSAGALGALWLGAEALIAFICVVCMLANLFVTKEIMLVGLHATGSDAFTIGATVGLNLLQEYHGQAITRKAIIINFCLLIFYALCCKIHLLYTPSMSDTMHDHYYVILGIMPRIVVASFTVYYLAQLVDCYMFGFLKKHWSTRLLMVRNSVSVAISQFVDTALFTIFGLYGIVSHLAEVMVISYSVKLLAIVCIAPFVQLSRLIMRRS